MEVKSERIVIIPLDGIEGLMLRKPQSVHASVKGSCVDSVAVYLALTPIGSFSPTPKLNYQLSYWEHPAVNSKH